MAIQKNIQSLIDNGLPIQAVSGKGYSLEKDIHLLEESEIMAGLSVVDRLHKVEVFQSIDSTNSYLLGQPVQIGKAHICAAEAQRSGRGRRGNHWQSAPYRNVMLSLSWGFDHWPATITGLGLAVSLALTECLNANYDVDVKIKWPNDLLVQGDKLAGVLIDVAGESSGACNVVIGVGLNVHQPDWSDSAESDYRWQDMRGLGAVPNRNALIAQFSDALIEMLADFSRYGFSPLCDRWNALSSYAGRQVLVGDNQQQIKGRMIGVDALGSLLVLDEQEQTHVFTESTVSVRLLNL